MENEFIKEQKNKFNRKDESSDSEVDDLKEKLQKIEIPKNCPICEEKLVSPIVTNCEHFFCEKCAIEDYQKNKKCFVCNKITNGNLNDAKKDILKLKT